MTSPQIQAWLSTWLGDKRGLVATIGLLPPAEPAEQSAAAINLPAATVVDLDTINPAVGLPRPADPYVAVIARTVTDLRRAVTLSAAFPEARSVLVVVHEAAHRDIRPPAFGPGDVAVETAVIRRGSAREWSVEVLFKRSARAGSVLLALNRGLAPRTPLPVQRVGLAGVGAADWRPGDYRAQLTGHTGPMETDNGVPVADLVLRSIPVAPWEEWHWKDPWLTAIDRPQPNLVTWENFSRLASTEDLQRYGDLIRHIDQVPPVDELSVNPSGFQVQGTNGVVELRQVGDCWQIHETAEPNKVVVRIHPSGNITDADVARLRPYRAVRVVFGRHTGPIAAVRALAGLACAGVPLVAAEVPPWAQALGPELIAVLTSVTEEDLADDLTREVHSIRLRRAGLRTHSTRARWLGFAATAGLPTASDDVSIVMCTMRPEFLGSALQQVSRQQHENLELILVLHGLPADHPAVRSTVAEFDRPLTVLEVDSTVPFGSALNRGVAAASGRFVTKWDDDDWFGPQHISDVLLAKHYSGADLVGCHMGLVYLEEINLTVYRKGWYEMYNQHITGTTMLMERHTFHEVGGFRPQPRSEDTSLRLDLVAAGGRTYTTHGLGCIINRRANGHTWSVSVAHFLRGAARQWRGFTAGPLIEADEAELGEAGAPWRPASREARV